MKVRGLIERVEDGKKILAGFGFEDDLPGIAGISALMESGHWRGDNELLNAESAGRLNNFCVQV